MSYVSALIETHSQSGGRECKKYLSDRDQPREIHCVIVRMFIPQSVVGMIACDSTKVPGSSYFLWKATDDLWVFFFFNLQVLSI